MQETGGGMVVVVKRIDRIDSVEGWMDGRRIWVAER